MAFGLTEAVLVAHGDSLGLAHWVFLQLLPSINYAIFPLVQTLSSQELRAYIFGCKSACCDAGRKRGTNVPEVLQLQVLPNGNAPHN